MRGVAFSDESKHYQGRYRGVGLISCHEDHSAEIRNEIIRLLKESNVREFKWEKLRTAQYRLAAIKMAEAALSFAVLNKMRIDVLVWDTQDERHNISGRDDRRNFQIMYYQLFKNVLKKKWPSRWAWQLFPDEQDEIDWQIIKSILESINVEHRMERHVWSPTEISVSIKHEFGIDRIAQKKSHEEPLIQMADLFVGMAVYSRSDFGKYLNWLLKEEDVLSLFANELAQPQKLSSGDSEKCFFIRHLDSRYKSKKLPISLKTTKGFQTRNPKCPINFWFYKPQHINDKAPVTAAHVFKTHLMR